MTDRREFLQSLAAIVAAAPFTPRTTDGGRPTIEAGMGAAAAAGRLIGVQMGAHTMLDEGIEPALDLCRGTAMRTAATSGNRLNGSPPITASHPSISGRAGFRRST
jgi:hypothetical protein